MSTKPPPQPSHQGIALPNLEWLAGHTEDALQPELPIIDAHHHLWELPGSTYLREELMADLATGHRIQATVYVECHSHYDAEGRLALRPVGETRFVAGQSAASGGADGTTPSKLCAGIVGWADLTLGDQVQAVLEAHVDAGQGRFRGIRARPTWHGDPTVHPAGQGQEGVLRDANVQRAIACAGKLGLSLDIWVYHTQLEDVEHLAARSPQTLLVLDHCGGPLGIGPFAEQRHEVFDTWRARIKALAAFPNVRLKLGGLTMPRIGFGFERTERPASSEVLAKAWAPWIETCIEAFGPERCMFESNFPVDKVGCNYAVLWNAFKRITQGSSAADQAALFHGTAAEVYRLEGVA
ncbi:amidohydrolase family protein [Ottowia sp. VDI28]|uniref:amidohydrolase family protein n=1 Tax=Ottowia sp. VDI28 TaxID=3133968 RepID=UPI003C2F9B68